MKENWIDQIKGISILLVVLYHSVITFYTFIPGYDGAYREIIVFWKYFNQFVAPFRMPVFFFISGFLAYKYINVLSMTESLYKRVYAVLWPLVVWLTLQTISVSYINEYFNNGIVTHTPLSNIFYSDNLSTFVYNLLGANTSLWYLYALIIYFFIFKLCARRKNTVVLVCFFLNIASNFTQVITWGIDSICTNAIFFGIGSYYGPEILEIFKRTKVNVYFLLFGGIVSIVFYAFYFRIFLCLLSIFVIIRMFLTIENRKSYILDSFSIIGRNTLAIYVTHRILLEFFSLMALKSLKYNWLEGLFSPVLLLLYPLVSSAVCVVFGVYFREFTQKYFRDFLFSIPKGANLFRSRVS